MRACTKCGSAQPLAQFPPVRRGKPQRQTWCRACFAVANAANYAKNRKREKARLIAQVIARRELVRRNIVMYLSAHPCVDCAESDIVVLEFDHRGDDKVADVATYGSGGRTWERVLEEIRKCDVRCANCHRRVTARRVAARRPGKRVARRRRRGIQLHLADAAVVRECRICLETKPRSQFPFRSTSRGTHQRICLMCQRAWTNAWYQRRVGRAVRRMRQRGTAGREPLMRIVFAHLASHPCVDCAEADPIVLEFDHRGDKSANVSDLVASAAPSAVLRAEMAKCDIRCANCHRRKTVKEVGGYRLRA
jgi:hypothetical protein